ncbi:putative urea active transporter 1 [Teratosphaeria destructans]|uniref:Urea active transporter 1 n=1 Tax=Teratosphaeria destructans TaxID=418781 RepID=A0A9W7SVN0_9PEZI|nr:putative urea active transporter 1 [Teratosphaeria destructans]
MSTTPPLSQATGYGIVIGLGFLFAFGMMLTTFVLRRYNNELQTSEVFATAGRTVKSGLVASAVVSSWTWAATLLQSSSVAYKYGVSGPFWYASGATVQVILFATLAIELKRKAPNAHTFLEAIRARYGSVTHGVFITFGLMTNILVTAMLLTGGSAVVETLTGMPTAAACFLLPVGVVLYTMFGGIKATFLTDYVHTVMILTILFIFAFTVYATSSVLGSPGAVYDALVAAAARHPVDGNQGGSYLTMKSTGGGIFFIINLTGNFGTVFCDNGYYNKAIAASPVHALPGYIAGGLSWFAIPWLCATTMGLSALALEDNPVFPTYPNRMATADVTAGLVLPNAAVALLGKGGAVATLLVVFMAVTSAMSAELIAVSSIWTYDIYQTYINPSASGRRLIHMSHVSCVVYALIMAAFSTGLYYAGISMGYLYLMMGVIISGAVVPASLSLLWDLGWLVQAKREYGDLSVASTGSNNPMLVGNLVSLLVPMVSVPVLSFIPGLKQPKYDWLSMKLIRKADDHDLADAAHIDLELVPGESRHSEHEEREEQQKLQRAAKIARTLTIVLSLALLILWPMPMFGSGYIFSKPFFTGWVTVGILWLFCSSICVGIYPLWEGRHTSSRTIKAIFLDLAGKRKSALHGRAQVAEIVDVVEKRDGKGIETPPEKAVEG